MGGSIDAGNGEGKGMAEMNEWGGNDEVKVLVLMGEMRRGGDG